MMMRRLFQFLPLLALLAACTGEAEKTSDTKPQTEAQKQASIEQVKLHFTGPVLIDSSAYVMYPLLLRASEGEADGYDVRKGRSNTYWNIAFYNTETGESHLLAASRKMIIEGYGAAETSGGTPDYASGNSIHYMKQVYEPGNQLLYYSIKIDDYNHDGVIDDKDPTYLFTSDKNGREFKQISPANYNIESWQLVQGARKVLIQAKRDTDNNKAFDDDDITTPFVYTIRSGGPAKEVFSKEFNSEVKEMLHNQWATKP
jgi:hypothetical protein